MLCVVTLNAFGSQEHLKFSYSTFEESQLENVSSKSRKNSCDSFVFSCPGKNPSINGNLKIEILNSLSMQINFDLLGLLFFVNVMKEITSNLIEQIKKASIIIAEYKRGFRNEFYVP